MRADGTFYNSEGFNSAKEACATLDPDKYTILSQSGNSKIEYISRYINLEYLVTTVSGSFYFVANPITLAQKAQSTKSIPIALVNIFTGETQFFDSVTQMYRQLGVKPIRYKLYLDQTRVWQTQYRLFSRDNFYVLYPDSINLNQYTVDIRTL